MGNVESLEELRALGLDLLARDLGAGAGGVGLLDKGFFLLFAHRVAGGLEFLIEILELLSGVGLVLGQVKGAACSDALEFVGAEGEFKENVDAGACVVSKVGLQLPVVVEHVGAESDRLVVGGALRDPVAMPHFPPPIGLGLR